MRSRYRRILRSLSSESRWERSDRICRNLSGWLRKHTEVRHLATYAALPGEPDLGALHDACRGTSLVYPLVRAERGLSFHRVNDPNDLVEGSYGIMEPSPALHAELDVGDIDGFLCPGLAFDLAGTRLGRGGGFYDRALEGARPDARRVGVGFAAQVAAALPRESHDIVMAYLATEDGVRPVRPSPGWSS